MSRAKILFILGTRPEAIKLATLIILLKNSLSFDVLTCATGQHREMLDQVLHFFEIKPSFDLDIMCPDQSLYDTVTASLNSLCELINKVKPNVVIVQGDTTTTFVGALAAFYNKISVVHIEAGLRSKNKYAPFPEELNRVLTSHIADIHFAPTKAAKRNLLREGIPAERIFITGNTGIDTLLFVSKKMEEEPVPKEIPNEILDICNSKKRIILVTGHRRENFGEPLKNICLAIKDIVKKHKDVNIIYPVHLNPNVKRTVSEFLRDVKHVNIIEPLPYPLFVWLMARSYLILTDSGGIQEEAPSLGKPVLIMREVTERPEGIMAGSSTLVGNDRKRIINEVELLLTDRMAYLKRAKAVNPYGDGKACIRIKKELKKFLKLN